MRKRRLMTWALAGAAVAAALWTGLADRLPARAVAEMALDAKSVGSPVVVELFTSQGCSSCPPADELLGELAQHDSVIALAHHIDYWDYIGWKDPFASKATTDRQRAYAKRLGLRYVYTPQMVVDGRIDVVGSRRGKVMDAIETAAKARKAVEVRFAPEDGKVVIPAGHAPDGGAAVWLAVFDDKHETPVPSGENAGRTLEDYNVVRELTRIGTWRGERMEIAVDLGAAAARGRDGCAVIVQQHPAGPVLGATMMRLDG